RSATLGRGARTRELDGVCTRRAAAALHPDRRRRQPGALGMAGGTGGARTADGAGRTDLLRGLDEGRALLLVQRAAGGGVESLGATGAAWHCGGGGVAAGRDATDGGRALGPWRFHRLWPPGSGVLPGRGARGPGTPGPPHRDAAGAVAGPLRRAAAVQPQRARPGLRGYARPHGVGGGGDRRRRGGAISPPQPGRGAGGVSALVARWRLGGLRQPNRARP